MKRKKALRLIKGALENVPESYHSFDWSTAYAPWGNGERWLREYAKNGFAFYLGIYDGYEDEDKIDYSLILCVTDDVTDKEIARAEIDFRECEKWSDNDVNRLIRELTLVLKCKAEELEKQIAKRKGTIMKPVDPDVRHLTDIFECSKCGNRVHLGEYMREYEYEFCPNCGRPVYSENQ